MRKTGNKKAYFVSLFAWLIIVLIGNALSVREDVVHYSRLGKVWGIPYPVSFQYYVKNAEVIEGYYEKNLVYNFVIYAMTGLLLLFLVHIYINKPSRF